jgi:serine/threonine protein kinase
MRRIANYEVLDEIGRGGQGVVWRARLTRDECGLHKGDVVALKMLNSELRRPHEAILQFDHPGIVRYRDVFLAEHGLEERWFVVMDALKGITLERRILQCPRGLPWPEARVILMQCIEACAYAEARGITHRDLKPHNVMLLDKADEGGCRIKLIDFDIARDEGKMTAGSSRALLAGTADYMAPECVLQPGFKGDAVSDIFSFGVLAYQTLSGRLPFPGVEDAGGAAVLFERWKNAEKIPKTSFRTGTFLALEREAGLLLEKCLAVERSARYVAFEALRAAFEKIRPRQVAGHSTYELTGFLGRGGLGNVYSGCREPDLYPVALKQPRMDGVAKSAKERFCKEAEALREAPHPHIVQFIEYIQNREGIGDIQTLVMELLPGAPEWCLHRRIRNSPNGLPLEECLGMFACFAEALHYLHGKGFVHRDIKPSNLYAPPGDPQGAKLFDMGVVRSLRGTQTAGSVPGTFDYMAPEQARKLGERGTPATDVYALGLSFFEALTGKFPFRRFARRDLLQACRELFERGEGKRDQLSVIDFSAPCFASLPGLRGVVCKALAFRPEERFDSAAHMGETLADLLAALHRDVDSESETISDGIAAPTVGSEIFTRSAFSTRATRVPEPGETAPGYREGTIVTQPVESLDTEYSSTMALTIAERFRLWRVRSWLWRWEHARPLRLTAWVAAVLFAAAAIGAAGLFLYNGKCRGEYERIVHFSASLDGKPLLALVDGDFAQWLDCRKRAERWARRSVARRPAWRTWLAEMRQKAHAIPLAVQEQFDGMMTSTNLSAGRELIDLWEVCERHGELFEQWNPQSFSAAGRSMMRRLGRLKADAAVAQVLEQSLATAQKHAALADISKSSAEFEDPEYLDALVEEKQLDLRNRYIEEKKKQIREAVASSPPPYAQALETAFPVEDRERFGSEVSAAMAKTLAQSLADEVGSITASLTFLNPWEEDREVVSVDHVFEKQIVKGGSQQTVIVQPVRSLSVFRFRFSGATNPQRVSERTQEVEGGADIRIVIPWLRESEGDPASKLETTKVTMNFLTKEVANPPIQVSYRVESGSPWQTWDKTVSALDLEKGQTYVFRYARPDYIAIEEKTVCEGRLLELSAPALARWEPVPTLAKLWRMDEAVKTRNWSAVDKERPGDLPEDLVWHGHIRRWWDVRAWWESHAPAAPAPALGEPSIGVVLDNADLLVSKFLRWYYQKSDPWAETWRRNSELPVPLNFGKDFPRMAPDRANEKGRWERLRLWSDPSGAWRDASRRNAMRHAVVNELRQSADAKKIDSYLLDRMRLEAAILSESPQEGFERTDARLLEIWNNWVAHVHARDQFERLTRLNRGMAWNQYDALLALRDLTTIWNNAVVYLERGSSVPANVEPAKRNWEFINNSRSLSEEEAEALVLALSDKISHPIETRDERAAALYFLATATGLKGRAIQRYAESWLRKSKFQPHRHLKSLLTQADARL